MRERENIKYLILKTILLTGNNEIDTLIPGMTLKLVLFDGVTSLFEVYSESCICLGVIKIDDDELSRLTQKGALRAFSSCATIEVVCANCGTPDVVEDPPGNWKCRVCGSYSFERTTDF